jgi:hypothetical protein
MRQKIRKFETAAGVDLWTLKANAGVVKGSSYR